MGKLQSCPAKEVIKVIKYPSNALINTQSYKELNLSFILSPLRVPILAQLNGSLSIFCQRYTNTQLQQLEENAFERFHRREKSTKNSNDERPPHSGLLLGFETCWKQSSIQYPADYVSPCFCCWYVCLFHVYELTLSSQSKVERVCENNCCSLERGSGAERSGPRANEHGGLPIEIGFNQKLVASVKRTFVIQLRHTEVCQTRLIS